MTQNYLARRGLAFVILNTNNLAICFKKRSAREVRKSKQRSSFAQPLLTENTVEFSRWSIIILCKVQNLVLVLCCLRKAHRLTG